jgi:AAA+ ATPase superfamily predicted ATPase
MFLVHNHGTRIPVTNLPFLNRRNELGRLRALLGRRSGTLAVLYGRRRCGKSRLIQRALPPARSIYYVGDDREPALQRASLAAHIARRLPGFDRAVYPEWDALLDRFWREAPSGTVLALDEFPALAGAAPELPSLLQKRLDQRPGRQIHLILSGSSQRMMQGLVLDRSAPLYGRAQEILKIGPLGAGWIQDALEPIAAVAAIDACAVWGGIPRYWELARSGGALDDAVKTHVLSPLGVLHHEPAMLLLDDLRDTTQAASILSVIGQGAHRASEIAGRLEKPATSLARPLARLVELDLVRRETPFGVNARDSKRAFYEVADPFLRFWFRFVEPNRSRLAAGQIDDVWADVQRRWAQHVAATWEELARQSVPKLRCHGHTWQPANRWWGAGQDRTPMEIDVVAESTDGKALLLGEVRWSDGAMKDEAGALALRAANFPDARGRTICLALWLKRQRSPSHGAAIFTPSDVLRVLR